ncbi:hypothetical protein PHLCEN_2v1964 [Hermanssonia centrifuga]|uniref:Uncharacterized protein n=1 Tax=Hermanssonia centrifuga TaxID=98765 RepID=A0A2R6RVF2_9APHY|nr:hypothetical protein PHLCEN_2v1964 [Hermanssonia centrifuga]
MPSRVTFSELNAESGSLPVLNGWRIQQGSPGIDPDILKSRAEPRKFTGFSDAAICPQIWRASCITYHRSRGLQSVWEFNWFETGAST